MTLDPGEFIVPRYADRCFTALPRLVGHLLAGGPAAHLPPETERDLHPAPRAVVWILLDAFGWRGFTRHADHPFLRTLSRAGVIAQLTAQFPSTTTAHITCAHTGLPVGQSGLVEWNYYEPRLDAMITPLLFSFAGDRRMGTLAEAGVRPEDILPTHTLHQELADHGVRCHVFQPRHHATSPYSRTVLAGAQVHGYRTLAEALVGLSRVLRSGDRPMYAFLYVDTIDVLGHEHGPDAAETDAETDAVLDQLGRWVLGGRAGGDDVLYMLSADHGMVESYPSRTIYLNQASCVRDGQRFLRRNAAGRLLVPGGSCRDMFLYLEDGCLEEACAFFGERLEPWARVRRVDELSAAGYFGPEPLCPEFSARAGELVILPYRNESVWWYQAGRFEQSKPGYHGGLTRSEMEIPLLLWRG